MDSVASDLAGPAAEVFTSSMRVEPYAGSRADLPPLLELAEDSPAQLDSCLSAGRVLVALCDRVWPDCQVDGSPGPDA